MELFQEDRKGDRETTGTWQVDGLTGPVEHGPVRRPSARQPKRRGQPKPTMDDLCSHRGAASDRAGWPPFGRQFHPGGGPARSRPA